MRVLLPVLCAAACAGPLDPVVEREAPWWGPTDVLEEAVGIDLVDLPQGEPLGYWPRLVLHEDHITFDDRAWLLSLPDEVLEGLEPAELELLLIEEPRVVALEGGRVPEAARKGSVITPLYEALFDERREAIRDLVDQHDLGFPSTVVIVPDEAVPWETVRMSIYTVGQAAWLGEYVLAGAHQGRLRGATWRRDSYEDCALMLTPTLEARGATVATGVVPALADAEGQCPIQGVDGLSRALESLVQTCGPLWEAAAEEAAAASHDPEASRERIPDPEDWLCVEVWPKPHGDMPASAYLPMLAELGRAGGRVHLGPIIGGDQEAESCSNAVQMEALDEAQRELVCGVAGVRRGFELDFAPPDPDATGLAALLATRGRRVGGPPPGRSVHDPLDPVAHAAFPAWAAEEDERRAKERAENKLRYEALRRSLRQRIGGEVDPPRIGGAP